MIDPGTAVAGYFRLSYLLWLAFCILLYRVLRLAFGFFRHRNARLLVWPYLLSPHAGKDEDSAAEHIRQMAQGHKAVLRRGGNAMLRYVRLHLYLSLQHLRLQLNRSPADIILMIPASLRLFDNFHLIYSEMKKLQESRGALRALRFPVVVEGTARSYPRIYALAQEILSCSNHLSVAQLEALILAYQEERELSCVELSHLRNALALCLMEEIVNLSGKILEVIRIKTQAEAYAQKALEAMAQKNSRLSDLLPEPPFTEGDKRLLFVSHIALRLRNAGADEGEIASWLLRIQEGGDVEAEDPLAALLAWEAKFEATLDTGMGTLITSLKTNSAMDWEKFFLRLSLLDRVLEEDPGGVYGRMDRVSKARYRAVIEKLSRRYRKSETEVGHLAVLLADQAREEGEKRSHVGYYLIHQGFYELVSSLGGAGRRRRIINRLAKAIRKRLYFVGIPALWAAMMYFLYSLSPSLGRVSTPLKVLLLCLLALPASDPAIQLLNRLFTYLRKPRPLPALDLEKGIPAESSAFIVMPTILSNAQQMKDSILRLENHYLLNRQENLFFGLLVDYHDAPSPTVPSDEEILRAGVEGIRALNHAYSDRGARFFLFVRPRQWNPAQGCWMGWERKRGKLEAFNAYLCGEDLSGLVLAEGGEPESIPDIRYVITLDADTEILSGSAAKLIGIMSHPLNRPETDLVSGRIRDGYAIIQAEVRIRIPTQRASLFTRFFSSQIGIDPYATLVSDIYQDLFGEGIFIGKGIYDLRVFHRILGGAIPENTVLSHDLLEGSLTRCAFASGIRFLESCPGTVLAFTRREHRWIRGDWQLLPWIVRKLNINGLSLWKMLDNLRRSLVKPSLIMFISANALLCPEDMWISLLLVAYDPVLRFAEFIFRLIWKKMRNPTSRFAAALFLQQLYAMALQTFIDFALLPYRGFIAMDAVFRTLYRLLISRKNLLEWLPAAQSYDRADSSWSRHWKEMWPALLPAAATASAALRGPSVPQLIFWSCLSGIWALSPVIACAISRRRAKAGFPGYGRQLKSLRLTARRTWRYFEDFTKTETHWLCPDNVQIRPWVKVSNKTSPTNIGLQLLSLLSARDLGYIGLRPFVLASERIIKSLASLPKWKGHLYNWYNIRTLQVLSPRYVSTVDNGNFFAHLLAFRQGLLHLKSTPVMQNACFAGLRDTAALAGLPADAVPKNFKTVDALREALHALISSPLADSGIDEEWSEKFGRLCREYLRDIYAFGLSGPMDGQKSLSALSDEGNPQAAALVERIDRLSSTVSEMIWAADFSLLLDEGTQLFTIGYNDTTHTPDAGQYDLLASECRLASFLAIAKNEVPARHWSRLGRPMTIVRGIPACVSWSGSMFEYLMPRLVMKARMGSLLQQSCLAAVIGQISYANRLHIPWGISESQYYSFDAQANYQYSPFGVKRLRLQASLRPSRVIAPYATMLALSVLPGPALKNLDRLRKLGGEGNYGFYEALDFNRPDAGLLKPFSLVHSFMAHHQGMSLAAINNLIHEDILPRRFHAEPIIRSCEYLLEEKLYDSIISLARRGYALNIERGDISPEKIASRSCSAFGLSQPFAHIMSNNHYTVLVTSDGAGFSRCDNVMVSRWQPETLADQPGCYIYLHDLASGRKWSATWLPTRVHPDEYLAVFRHDAVEYIRRDGCFSTSMSLTVSPLFNLEVRHVSVSNNGDKPVEIEFTSYLEPVADSFMADHLHPAFSKLFLETEYVAELQTLITRRRKRSPKEEPRYILHTVLADSPFSRPVQFEIDRMNFVGRGGSLAEPAALGSLQLSSRDGFSREPILSLRAAIEIPPGETRSVSYIFGFCRSRDEALNMRRELSRPSSVSDTFNLARTSSNLEISYLNLTSAHFVTAENMASYLYYPCSSMRGNPESIRRLRLGQSGLWRWGISGDYPVILAVVSKEHRIPVIKDILICYEYLRINTANVDLVFLIEEPAGYTQAIFHVIEELTRNLRIPGSEKGKPSLFVLRGADISDQERDLLEAFASLRLDAGTPLYQQVDARMDLGGMETTGIPSDRAALPAGAPWMSGDDLHDREEKELEYFNGFGGFAMDGREYEIRLGERGVPPLPWVNVIANKDFGFIVSELGGGFTWSDSSQENRLTPWHNDPVLDPISEAVYIRDNAGGGITSPAALRAAGAESCRVRHGFGYTVFERSSMDLRQEMTLFVPSADRVKLWLLRLKNLSSHERSLNVVLFVDWALGVTRSRMAPFVETGYEVETELFTARCAFSDVYRDSPAYLFSSEPISSFSGDKRDFFGPAGSCRYPEALRQEELINRIGVGLDPCGAILVRISLAPSEEKTLVFGMGQADSLQAARETAQAYRDVQRTVCALEEVRKEWSRLLGTVTVRTPDRAMDLLVNGWLVYQVLSCRMRARAAFYQSGGAFGFRDQLQDCLSLLDSVPHLVRDHILRCSARQFPEGDVQHWWHPQSGVGVRTRISDDLLWLPYVTAAYVERTGDESLLDEEMPFVTGRQLDEDQAELLFTPEISQRTASVYDHCVLAIEKAGGTGRHGLPLMGGGDWNDGMNRVGIKGRGESVWLAWFLFATIKGFLPIVSARDSATAELMRSHAEALRSAAERHAWDGEWYLRAFDDHGEALGSSTAFECRIDSISQSWATLSGAASRIRAATALDSAYHHLVREGDGVSLLLSPPFDRGPSDPGYIKGYSPGVRENGGQYTHAAVWLAMAFARSGNTARSAALLRMLNPIHASETVSLATRYACEPYVLSADISSEGAYTGRGGWSWYTGSAAWMYQALLRDFLGLKRVANRLSLAPAVPSSYKRFVVDYRYGSSLYEITVLLSTDGTDEGGVLFLDGVLQKDMSFELADDNTIHVVECRVGSR